MSVLHELAGLPSFRELFTIRTPLDLVGIGVFFLILYVIVFGTGSMIYHQLKSVFAATLYRQPAPICVGSYAKCLINGTCAELQQLQVTYTPSARVPLLKTICNKLKADSTPLAISLRKQFARRLAQEDRLARADKHPSKKRERGSEVYVSSRIGSA